MNPFRFIANYLRREPRPLDGPVSFDDRLFWRDFPNPFKVEWCMVRRITGYKMDLLTWDEIRMEFALANWSSVVVTEESPGFPQFMQEVERRFPAVADWHGRISQPPFAPRTTVLFEAIDERLPG
jgi:hypothetical protein